MDALLYELYELEEPLVIEEDLLSKVTLQGYDDTTVYLENSVTPFVQYKYNALIPYKEEILKQKIEIGVNQLDIENNIIPYLMDIEFNLIMMEDI